MQAKRMMQNPNFIKGLKNSTFINLGAFVFARAHATTQSSPNQLAPPKWHFWAWPLAIHLTLLKIKSFVWIQMAHKVTPINKDHNALNFFTLLGKCLLNMHHSHLRAFIYQLELGGSVR